MSAFFKKATFKEAASYLCKVRDSLDRQPAHVGADDTNRVR